VTDIDLVSRLTKRRNVFRSNSFCVCVCVCVFACMSVVITYEFFRVDCWKIVWEQEVGDLATVHQSYVHCWKRWKEMNSWSINFLCPAWRWLCDNISACVIRNKNNCLVIICEFFHSVAELVVCLIGIIMCSHFLLALKNAHALTTVCTLRRTL
jgi:hypothetical protein